ncbi:dihydroorotase [Phocaeicola sp.]|uniref:dihydroorotase n=1 Tax=Phocaeicola sp. TaxID=2773926 RepID=UPI0023C81F48|nr:dihydroorotase [Phocaeicola sp.]MDE5677768.1 dihydroorotase [Phocaeicola sp.]
MKRTWIKNAQIVNEGKSFSGSIVIENEIIAEVLAGKTEPSRPCEETIDAKGYYLIPGVIDDHVHFRDPGLTHKANMHTESTAAAAGGVTSFMDMPNTNPQTTTIEALNAKFDNAATQSVVNYSFYFGATNTNADILPTLDKTRICGIKLFMGASTGNMLVDRMEVLQQIFANAGMLIAAHCEEQSIISANTASFKEKYGDDPDIKCHPQIRSTEACVYSSSLAIRLAKENKARLHILHISTAQELDLLEDKPLNKKAITAEACVSHLYFDDKDYDTLKGRIKCNPSIKTPKDKDALRNALSTNRIDVIGTDHAPHLLEEKEGGALKAVSGMPMIQFSLIAIMELVRKGVLTIEQLVQKMCHAPAELYSIERRGYIRPGYQADLVLVNPNHEWTVTANCVLSKCGWSPMEGQTFHTRVEKTFINGNLVYNDNKVNENHRGQELRFKR